MRATAHTVSIDPSDWIYGAPRAFYDFGYGTGCGPVEMSYLRF